MNDLFTPLLQFIPRTHIINSAAMGYVHPQKLPCDAKSCNKIQGLYEKGVREITPQNFISDIAKQISASNKHSGSVVHTLGG